MTSKAAHIGFDMGMAELCARLCALSYKDNVSEIQDEVMDCDFDHVSFYGYDVPHHDTESFLVWNDDLAILVFRGIESDEPKDILADLKFRRKDAKVGRVHRGFQGALDAVYTPIYNDLLKLVETRHLIITGHSLGAALACLAAGRFERHAVNKCAVYTFGSPRVGGKLWSTKFDMVVPHYRIVNCTDIVPRVPFFSMGFRHTGKLQYINAAGDLIQECDFWVAFMDRWTETLFGYCDGFSGWTFLRGIKDHSIYQYLERVRNVKRIHAPVNGGNDGD